MCARARARECLFTLACGRCGWGGVGWGGSKAHTVLEFSVNIRITMRDWGVVGKVKSHNVLTFDYVVGKEECVFVCVCALACAG